MSATLLLVIPDIQIDLIDLRGHLEPAFVVSGDGKSLTVGRPCVREKVFVVQVLDFISEGLYEDWPDECIPPGPASVFSFDYVSVKLMLDIVEALVGRFDAIVDTNFGSVIPMAELTGEHLPADLA
jgi:hypothetical protein